MRLKEWLEQKNLNQYEFAELVQAKQPMISQIINGHRRPSPELALRIEAVTKGKVKMRDWFVKSLAAARHSNGIGDVAL
jgi:transcriptional regulator with XRE-family HTH domain